MIFLGQWYFTLKGDGKKRFVKYAMKFKHAEPQGLLPNAIQPVRRFESVQGMNGLQVVSRTVCKLWQAELDHILTIDTSNISI
jgi:hypothetical protein